MDKWKSFLNQIKKMDDGRASLLLLLLLSTDFVFITLHIINRIIVFDEPRRFRVDIDGSYPEVYQYIKYFWIILLFIYTMGLTHSKGYVAWILIFFYFLVDDALALHEDLGRQFDQAVEMNAPLALRVQDIGEFIVFALFALLLMTLLVWAYRRGSPVFKKVSRDLLILLAAFAFFVVVIDVVQAALDLGQSMYAVVALMEDGGEMLVGSLMVWYVFWLSLHGGEPETFLYQGFAQPKSTRGMKA